MKNKFILFALCAVMLFSLCACGSSEPAPAPAPEATAAPAETEAPAQTEEPAETEAPAETPEPTEAPEETPAPTEEPAETQTPAPADTPAPAGDPKEIAKSLEGHPVSELYAAIGYPSGSDYSPSCLGDGDDGELYYEGFTVYTYREGNSEEVYLVP